jgi:hypothetical protein
MLPNILLSRLTRTEEITGDNRCGFRRNRSTADHIFRIHQIHEKKMEYDEAIYQLFLDFMKLYGSVRWEILYNILTNLLPVQFKSLLHGQEGCVFFQWAFKFTYVPVRLSTFSPAGDI